MGEKEGAGRLSRKKGGAAGADGGIRFARQEDIPAIMDFIETYWKPGHIMAHDREMFDFQHVYGDEVCFVLHENQESGEIESILGYIPYGTEGDRDMFSAIWKVGRKGGFLQGMELIRFLEANGRCRGLYGVGLATGAVSAMKYLRKQIVDFAHYYRLNPAVTDYRIAEIQNAPGAGPSDKSGEGAGKSGKAEQGRPEQKAGSFCRVRAFEEIASMLETCQEGRTPRKSPEFVKRRYFFHPEYVYDIWQIGYEGREALLVCRAQEAEGRCVYRVIDLIGDVSCIAGTRELFAQEFADKGYEYADCLVCGMDEAYMAAAGFVKKTETDGNIIPNYFEPFEKRNITIHNYMPGLEHAVMFKGDGDQDRPNYRKKE